MAPSRDVRNVGISACSIYFPKNCVSQHDLEKFDKVSAGKYTVGLGQQEMGFCSDNEDIASVAMTVTSMLIRDYHIDPNSIGYLGVGTETLIDKSKSVKTALMPLFGNNRSILGVDTKNACYGGAQALLNAVDYVGNNFEVRGLKAIVVAADIAVYEAGPARCTGGAGAVAFLIEPNAPIPIEKVQGVYMNDTWDFYKPIGRESTEYPTVDGPSSLRSYMTSLEECYDDYRKIWKECFDEDISLDRFSSVMFHSPFTKMVQKALARLAYQDHLAGRFESDAYASLPNGKTDLDDRDVQKVLMNASNEIWKTKTDPNLELNRRIGNMYTPSLFAQLFAYLARGHSDSLNRILMFAYGSGSAASMFSATVDVNDERTQKMQKLSKEAMERLDQRNVLTPEKYTECLARRERLLHAQLPVVPETSSHKNKSGDDDDEESLFPGTYYLAGIDEMSRRSYGQVPVEAKTNGINGINGLH